jgi:uncharacterized membrane protein (DUF441 family)
MNPGLLLLIILITIPFINEAKKLGMKAGRFPKFMQILRLRKTFRERWFKCFIVLFALFTLIALSPTASGKIYTSDIYMILKVLGAGTALWSYIAYRIKYKSRDN